MAAASNAAPVEAPLGASAADDAILAGSTRLLAPAPVFLALDDSPPWSLPGLPPPNDGDEDASSGYLAPSASATPNQHDVDLLPMLLSALEDERIDSARTSFGMAAAISLRTPIVGHA